MKAQDYHRLAMRTRPAEDDILPLSYEMKLAVNAAFGLTGESGELADLIKKHVFQGHPLHTDKVVSELGDILWYVCLMAESIGKSLDEIMCYNIEKLMNRYPDGFSHGASVNRPSEF